MRDRLIYFVYFGVILACVILYALEAQAGARAWYYTNVYPLEYKGVSVSHSVLSGVNRSVNRSMTYRRDKNDEWKIGTRFGDCEDYALTKMKILSSRGVPLKAMRLARGFASGERHMVLLVKTEKGEVILDNLNDRIRLHRGEFIPIAKRKGHGHIQ
jgi:predicted transglutaminase-like cysteine proteinase